MVRNSKPLRDEHTTRRFQTDSMLNRNSGYLFLLLNGAQIYSIISLVIVLLQCL